MTQADHMKYEVQYHAGNPNLCRVKGLKLKPMPECEGGGWFTDEATAKIICDALNHGVTPQAIPDGWKLVPIEPTDAMILAADSEFKKEGVYSEGGGTYRVSWKDLYKAMLSAAPSTATSGEVEG